MHIILDNQDTMEERFQVQGTDSFQLAWGI